MKKFLPTLIAIFLLTACGQTSVELNEESTTDNFKRNLECQKFRGRLEEDFSGETEINAIFYSPMLNSCLYNTVLVLYSEGSSYVDWELLDVFTNERIENFDSPDLESNNTVNSVSEFKEKIKEYQN